MHKKMYPEFQNLFEYDDSKEIECIRIKGERPVCRDCFVFESVDAALMFFSESKTSNANPRMHMCCQTLNSEFS